MYRRIILPVLFILITSFYVQAQNSRSPYSIFGPGEIQPKGFGKNLGMGGAGIGMPSGNFLNNLNPASYSGLDSLHFIYEAGFEGKQSTFHSQGDKKEDNTFNFKYISFGFRVNDWWATSIGVTPFSNVGYTIKTESYVEGSNSKYQSNYEGTGGINNVYIGNAIKLGKLSLGVNTSYMFGSIIQEELVFQPEDLFDPFIMQRTDYLHSFYFDYGLQYSFKLKKLDFTLGAIYSNQQNLVSRHQVDVKTTDYMTLSSTEYKSKHLKVPETMGIGINIRKGPFINVAADYELQKWSGIDYPIQRSEFLDSHRFAIGAETKPWGDIVTLDWYKKIVYRVGANYKTSYLNINGKQIEEIGITAGLGLPIKNLGTLVNFNVEVGKKGTVSNRLIRENYVLLHMNFSINEIWFRKRIFF